MINVSMKKLKDARKKLPIHISKFISTTYNLSRKLAALVSKEKKGKLAARVQKLPSTVLSPIVNYRFLGLFNYVIANHAYSIIDEGVTWIAKL